MNLKELTECLRSIDTSLQVIASTHSGNITTAFVNKKTMAARMSVPPVTIDKLIHQGLVSGGTSGLVEGKHYCKIDPAENNTNNFLFDAVKVMASAWNSFQ